MPKVTCSHTRPAPTTHMVCADIKACNTSEFRCTVSEFCIDESLRCNGENNCMPGEKNDELNCKLRHSDIDLQQGNILTTNY
jgi:hypothetical protein